MGKWGQLFDDFLYVTFIAVSAMFWIMAWGILLGFFGGLAYALFQLTFQLISWVSHV